jgi:hypothetical protein
VPLVLKVSRPGCYPGRIQFARTMQAAVPKTMLNTALRRHRAEGLHRPLKPGDLKRCRHEFPALDRLE